MGGEEGTNLIASILRLRREERGSARDIFRSRKEICEACESCEPCGVEASGVRWIED